jgi:hypothetical protein
VKLEPGVRKSITSLQEGFSFVIIFISTIPALLVLGVSTNEGKIDGY